jgi:hypothetical protein
MMKKKSKKESEGVTEAQVILKSTRLTHHVRDKTLEGSSLEGFSQLICTWVELYYGFRIEGTKIYNMRDLVVDSD